MDERDIILGELKEFRRATLSRLDEIDKEIKLLNQFKWRVAGVFSFLLLAVEAVKSFIGR